MSWSARQYIAFEDERTRPVRDLVSALPERDARSVIDLGCGPGNSTELLAARFAGAAVSGIDSSPDMIAAGRKRLPPLRFAGTGLETWDDPGPFDVILANAVLQWVPNHAGLLRALVSRLASGGGLAVQMPDNLDSSAHRLMREIAADGPWAEVLATAAAARTPIEEASWYYGVLRPLCARVDVWRTTYYHPIREGAAGIVEWFKGSGLRPFLEPLEPASRAAYLERYTAAVGGSRGGALSPFLEPLEPASRAAYLERYTAAVAEAYPALADGSVLLPFP